MSDTPRTDAWEQTDHDWQPDGGVVRFESHPHGEAPHVHTTCAQCGARAWFLEYQWELLAKGCTKPAVAQIDLEAEAKDYQRDKERRSWDDIVTSAKDAARYRWLRTFINFRMTDDRLNDERFPTLDSAVDYGMEKD